MADNGNVPGRCHVVEALGGATEALVMLSEPLLLSLGCAVCSFISD